MEFSLLSASLKGQLGFFLVFLGKQIQDPFCLRGFFLALRVFQRFVFALVFWFLSQILLGTVGMFGYRDHAFFLRLKVIFLFWALPKGLWGIICFNYFV